ncbi:uncharacterized protein LOC105846742 isoform X2 [Hydra vulgaris]|uniref:uncharacterized protein LOC105846742 isoform X2 n=1 Tax=Hydra vulgaris TaxID=6087 RepID=UPI00064130AA|nr:uncharacterized protein LOC105846742 isoform X2 [Hydra vulgaris]
MTLETKITTSCKKEIIRDDINVDFSETANSSIVCNKFASEVIVFHVTDESEHKKILLMRKKTPINEELATEVVLVDNSEYSRIEQRIINSKLLAELHINNARIEQLPTYLSLSKEFLHDEPPKYEIVTGKPLKTQLMQDG